MKKAIMLIIYVAIPLCVGALSSFLTRNAYSDYANLNRPIFSPPGSVFPVVWTILYILMGLGAYIVYYTETEDMSRIIGLALYYVQLIMNFVWSIAFFGQKLYLFAFIWLIVMWLVIIAMLGHFKKVSTLAFVLNVPLVVWCTFAAYLNLGTYILNR